MGDHKSVMMGAEFHRVITIAKVHFLFVTVELFSSHCLNASGSSAIMNDDGMVPRSHRSHVIQWGSWNAVRKREPSVCSCIAISLGIPLASQEPIQWLKSVLLLFFMGHVVQGCSGYPLPFSVGRSSFPCEEDVLQNWPEGTLTLPGDPSKMGCVSNHFYAQPALSSVLHIAVIGTGISNDASDKGYYSHLPHYKGLIFNVKTKKKCVP